MEKPDFYRYHAIFTYEDDGIHVVFPDLPGCVTYGKDEKEAIRMGKEALSLHICGMEQDGNEIPAPSCLKMSAENYLQGCRIDIQNPRICGSNPVEILTGEPWPEFIKLLEGRGFWDDCAIEKVA